MVTLSHSFSCGVAFVSHFCTPKACSEDPITAEIWNILESLTFGISQKNQWKSIECRVFISRFSWFSGKREHDSSWFSVKYFCFHHPVRHVCHTRKFIFLLTDWRLCGLSHGSSFGFGDQASINSPEMSRNKSTISRIFTNFLRFSAHKKKNVCQPKYLCK